MGWATNDMFNQPFKLISENIKDRQRISVTQIWSKKKGAESYVAEHKLFI